VVIPKPGKPDYSSVRAYRVISFLDLISTLAEHTVTHLIADRLRPQYLVVYVVLAANVTTIDLDGHLRCCGPI
jgi:hypothetical protein